MYFSVVLLVVTSSSIVHIMSVILKSVIKSLDGGTLRPLMLLGRRNFVLKLKVNIQILQITYKLYKQSEYVDKLC
jgi:hypothetical protein